MFLDLQVFHLPSASQTLECSIGCVCPGNGKRKLGGSHFLAGLNAPPPPGSANGEERALVFHYVGICFTNQTTTCKLFAFAWKFFLLLELFERRGDGELKTGETSHCSAP